MQKKYSVTGMSCAACASAVEKAALSCDLVLKAEVNLLANTLTVTLPDSPADDQPLYDAVNRAGYGLLPYTPAAKKDRKGPSFLAVRVICSAVFLLPLFYLAMGKMLGLPVPAALLETKTNVILQLLLVLPIVLLNFGYFKRGFLNLFRGHPNMDSLIAIGTTASLGYSLYGAYRIFFEKDPSAPFYFDGAGMILTLITLGKYLEARSKKKTGKAISALLLLAPEEATVFRGGSFKRVPAESLLPGDRILVRPGEKIAADGKVLSGNSAIDRSSMTGESIPVDVEVGDAVSAGTLNLTGSFEMIAEKVAADTALSKMIALVEQASAGKAPVGRLADKVASVFVPTVMTIALLAAAAWLFLTKDFQKAFEVGVSVLVIACPCSLGLATPAAIMAGTGKAAERGILFRSAAALENCGKVDTVVFDKTGTLTSGNLEATEIVALEKDEKELLAIAYALEARSEHPIARAILKKGEQEGITPIPCADFEALPGRGVRGTINGKAFAAGSQRQLSQSHPALQVPEWLLERLRGKTAVFLLEEGRLLGAIGLFDTPKADSKTAVESLKSKGITCIMLSGDRKETAELTGKELGIDRVISEVLPEEKQLHVAALKKEGRTVAMVGDGINDAPSLAAADMGIALGSGTDVAIESADTVLMNDSVLGVYDAIALSSKTLRIIKQNLFFAFFYNSIGITLAVLGLANPMIGAAAMSLSSFCVLSNALRLRHFKSKSEGTSPEKKENQLCTNACPVSQNGQAQNDRSFNDRSQNNETQKENNEMEKTLKIEGMMCPKCVAHVKNALEKVEGVTAVTVSLEKKNAVVSGPADAEALKNAVIEEGYEVLSVE